MKYETNTNRLKLCALCNNRITHLEIVCQEHTKEYQLYQNEQWFVEIVAMQQRQYEINVDEFRAVTNRAITSLQTSTKPRSKLTITDKGNIMRLMNTGKGWRKIARELNLNPFAVNKFIYRLKRKR